MSKNFRQELIESVDPEGQALYKSTLDAISSVIGCEGQIAAINIRVIKGIQQLGLEEAMLTTNGLATADGEIIDCGAALIKKKNGLWQRYSGKDTAHSTRIFSKYDREARSFLIGSMNDDRSVAVQPKSFHTSTLHPREGEKVTAMFGKDDLLEGVLENGPMTDHIRECLSSFEEDVENIGILLRHPSFHRPSDTRTPAISDINTLYSDGAQIHAMNRRTILDWQNKHMDKQMSMKSYRAGLELDAADMECKGMPPNIEDLIYEIRVRTLNHGDVPLYFTSLTPRCLVTQRDLIEGTVNAEPKLWNRKHRPRRPWDNQATMGANVDTTAESSGAIIRVGDRLTVISEKKDWRQ